MLDREARARVHLKDGETVLSTKESYESVTALYDAALRRRNINAGSPVVEFTFNGQRQTVDVSYIARIEESP